MRPSITGALEEKVREAAEAQGFDSPGELVRHAVRKQVHDVEDE